MRLMIIMICVSFFFGLFWFIFCDFNLTSQEKRLSEDEKDPALYENFIKYFGVIDKTVIE